MGRLHHSVGGIGVEVDPVQAARPASPPRACHLGTVSRPGFHGGSGFHSCLQAVALQCVGSRKPSGGARGAPVKAGSKSAHSLMTVAGRRLCSMGETELARNLTPASLHNGCEQIKPVRDSLAKVRPTWACRQTAQPKPPKGDQAGFEPAREGMDAGRCESRPVRGNGAPALVTLPHYASPVGGPMGCRVSRRRGAHLCAAHCKPFAQCVKSAMSFARQRRSIVRTARRAHSWSAGE